MRMSGGDCYRERPCARLLVAVIPEGVLGGRVWLKVGLNLEVGLRERWRREWHAGIQVSPMRDVGVGPRCRRAPSLAKVSALILGMQSNE